MGVYRLTLGWNHSVKGWSESYITPNVDAPGLDTCINDICRIRNGGLYLDDFWQGIRVSQLDVDKLQGRRQSCLILPGVSVFNPFSGNNVQIPAQGTLTNTPTGGQSILNNALQVNVRYNGSQITRHFLAPVPGVFIGTEPATILSDGQPWNDNIAKFYKYITGKGYQLQGQRITDNSYYLYVQDVIQTADTPPLLGIVTLKANLPTGIAVGSQVQASNFRPPKNQRMPTINGRWLVKDTRDGPGTGQSTVVLKDSDKVTPSMLRFGPKTTLRLVAYTLYPIEQMWDARVTTRKRGRPFSAPRGRRLTRLSLDP